MGNEAKRTTITIDGRAHAGDALLETSELFVRIDGEPERRKLPFARLRGVVGASETLAFEHDGARYAIEVRGAERWAAKIHSPPTLLDKLGIARGASVHVAGLDDDDAFGEALDAAKVVLVPLGAKAGVVVHGITTRAELVSIAKARRAVGDALVLWVAYPRGKKELGEDHVRAAAIEAGLVDVKVARFSDVRSALKLVVRKSERAKNEKKKR